MNSRSRGGTSSRNVSSLQDLICPRGASPPSGRPRRPRSKDPRSSFGRPPLSLVPELAPQGFLSPAWPCGERRAPHARNGGTTPTPTLPPFGHRFIGKHPVGMKSLGLRTALPPGRGNRAPPRKSPSTLSPGFPPKAFQPGLPPVEGRAPHARNVGITPTHMSPPFRHQPFARPSLIMTSPGLRPARTCGRGDRAPPRKLPFAPSRGFPRKASHRGLPPVEGRALHAR